MPTRYVIHVGPLKTGSTYIQQCLFAVRPGLLKHGIHYPQDFIGAGNNHMRVYAAMVRGSKRKLRKTFARINEEGHKTVVLSCEHLIFLTRDEWSILRDAIGVPDIEIVYATRRWSDRIPSIWSQNLFMGGHQTLPEFYLGLLNGRTPEYYPQKLGDSGSGYDIDYSLAWRDLVSVFGRSALRLFPYSALMDSKADIFVRFCTDVLGIQDVPKPKYIGVKRWTSLPADEAELLRTLNALYFKKFHKTTVGVRNMIMNRRVEIDRARFAAAMEGDIARLAIDDAAVQFDNAYSRMMEFADCVVSGPAMQTELFQRVARENDYYQQTWLLEPGISDALQDLLKSIVKAMEVEPAAWAAPSGPALKPVAAADQSENDLLPIRPLGQSGDDSSGDDSISLTADDAAGD